MMGNGRKMQTSTPSQFRDLEKANLGGVIFGCTKETIDECLSKQLFGLPAQHFRYVKNIDPGLPLFLFNYSKRSLSGIYEAASPGQMNLNPFGWTKDGSERTFYPAQVIIRTLNNCRPLLENQFSPVIKGNYYTPKHFKFELDHAQANKLITLFLTQAVAPSLSVKKNMSSLKMPNSRPPRLQNGVNDGISSSEFLATSSCYESNEETLQYLKDDQEANGKSEMELIYEKLQTFGVNSEPSNSVPVPQVKEPLGINMVHVEAGDSWQNHQEDDVKYSSFVSPDYPPIISELVLEMKELKVFKRESVQKIGQLEHKLRILESIVQSFQDHDDRALVPLPGNSETFEPRAITESCSYQLLDSDDFIFLAGGYDGKSWLATLESYYPSKDVIKSLCPMSSARSYASVTRLNGDICVIGGGPGGPDGLWYDTVESYNPGRNDWTSLACLNERKGSLDAVTLHDKIFALGGGNGVKSFSDVEMFDLDVERWIYARSMLQQRFALAAVELNGAIYAVGGFDGKDYLSSAERFDPREHSWSRLESMNSKRACHAMVVLNEKIYAVGGFDGSSMVANMEVFDPRLGTWMTDLSMNYERGYGAAVVVKNSIYAIGGLDKSENIVDKVERYVEGRGWHVTDLGAFGRRCFASAIV